MNSMLHFSLNSSCQKCRTFKRKLEVIQRRTQSTREILQLIGRKDPYELDCSPAKDDRAILSITSYYHHIRLDKWKTLSVLQAHTQRKTVSVIKVYKQVLSGWVPMDGRCVYKSQCLRDAPTYWSPTLILEIVACFIFLSNVTHLIIIMVCDFYQTAEAHQELDKEVKIDGKASVFLIWWSKENIPTDTQSLSVMFVSSKWSILCFPQTSIYFFSSVWPAKLGNNEPFCATKSACTCAVLLQCEYQQDGGRMVLMMKTLFAGLLRL